MACAGAPGSVSVRSTVRISLIPGAFGQPATVTALSYLGDLMQYELRCFGLTIQARGIPDPTVVEGAQVFWSVAPDSGP